MGRIRRGKNGEICLRVNGKMMMTVRPTPSVIEDTDIAMMIGYVCDIRRPSRYSDYEKVSYGKAKQAIHDWEYNTGSVTPLDKKMVTNYLSSNYYLAQIEDSTDMYDDYDEDCGVCQALLERVHEIFPSFVVKETEVIA